MDVCLNAARRRWFVGRFVRRSRNDLPANCQSLSFQCASRLRIQRCRFQPFTFSSVNCSLPFRGFSTSEKLGSLNRRSSSEENGNQKLVCESSWMDTPISARVSELLKLSSFNKSELDRAFEELDRNKNGVVEPDELEEFIVSTCQNNAQVGTLDKKQIDRFCEEFLGKFSSTGLITREEFDRVILEMANTVDPRVRPITISMVLTGTAVSVVFPVMPLFVTQLGLSTSQYGFIVSSFALSKLIGNIPSAFFADKYGCKPLMRAGLGMLTIGMTGVAFVESMEGLAVCRFISGFGASAFTTAATLSLMNMANPLNRTRTMAPISAGFHIGTSIGPAIGGFLAGNYGIQPTFLIAGTAFAFVTLINEYLYFEPKRYLQPSDDKNLTLRHELQSTMKQWKPLFFDKEYRSVLGISFAFWLALSGNFMTLLPLALVSPSLGLSPVEVGAVFMMMSAVNVVSSKPIAAVADRIGKEKVLVASTSLLGVSMLTFPIVSHQFYPSMVVLTVWALGSTSLSMLPTVLVTDTVPSKLRSQGLALLRTTCDVGLCLGSGLAGEIAMHSDECFSMQANAVGLIVSGVIFGLRSKFSMISNKFKNS